MNQVFNRKAIILDRFEQQFGRNGMSNFDSCQLEFMKHPVQFLLDQFGGVPQFVGGTIKQARRWRRNSSSISTADGGSGTGGDGKVTSTTGGGGGGSSTDVAQRAISCKSQSGGSAVVSLNVTARTGKFSGMMNSIIRVRPEIETGDSAEIADSAFRSPFRLIDHTSGSAKQPNLHRSRHDSKIATSGLR